MSALTDSPSDLPPSSDVKARVQYIKYLRCAVVDRIWTEPTEKSLRKVIDESAEVGTGMGGDFLTDAVKVKV